MTGARTASGWGLLLVLSLYLAVFAYAAARATVLAPYADMFDWIARYYRLQADGDWGAYLLAPHNYHRLVVTLGVLVADIRLFGGQGYLFVAVGLACLLGAAALLAREAVAAAPTGLKRAAGAMALMLALTTVNAFDAVTAINTTYVHGLVFSVAAIVLAEPGQGGAPNIRARFLGLACVVLAAFGNAVGLVALPVLALAAARRGEWRWLAVVLAAGAVIIGLYALGQPALSGGERGLGDLWRAAHLTLSYLDLPWSAAATAAGWLIGLVFAAASALALVFRGGREASRAERVAVMLILFSLGTAAMVALGRAQASAPSEAPVRYSVLLLPMHVGLLILALPTLARLGAGRAGLGAVAAAGLLLAQQLLSLSPVLDASARVRQAKADFAAGQRRPEMLQIIHPDLAAAEEISARMRRDGLYQREVFAPPPSR